jgi:N-hydroxyarylamine O-acetyltransferase
MTQGEPFHLQDYRERIGHAGAVGPTLEVLTSLHLEHLGRIPFENIDVRLGRPVALDLASLQAKLVERRRGGYCFEQNTLFAAALRSIGFRVETLEARVRPPGATGTLPRTHKALRLDLGKRRLGWSTERGKNRQRRRTTHWRLR